MLKIALDYPIIALSTLMPLLVIISVWRKRDTLEKPLKKVLWFSVFFFLSDLPLWITSSLNINNLKYNYIRELLNHMMIIGIYYFVLDSPLKKRVIIFLEIILIIIGAISLSLSKDAPTQVTSIYKLGLIVVVFMHFHTIMSELRITKILNYPFFWISAGVLLFSCGSILVMLFYTYTFSVETPALFFFYDQFLSFLAVLMFIFIGIGFLNSHKKYA